MHTVKIFYHLSQREKVKNIVSKIEQYNPILNYKFELEKLLSENNEKLLDIKSNEIHKKISQIDSFLTNDFKKFFPRNYEVKTYSFPSDAFTLDIAIEFFPHFKHEFNALVKQESDEMKKWSTLVRFEKQKKELETRRKFGELKKNLLQRICNLISNDKILFFETQNRFATFDLKEEEYEYFIPQNIVLYYRTSCSSSRKTKAFYKENLIVHRAVDIRKFPINSSHIQLSLFNSEEGFESILSNRIQGYDNFLKRIEKLSTRECIQLLRKDETKFLKGPFTVDEKREFVVLGGIEEELERLIPRQKRRLNF